MPKRESIDARTRLRIAAHLRAKMAALGVTAAEMARLLGVSTATMSRTLGGVGAIGLDLVIAMHRRLHIDANQLLDIDPPEKFFRVEP